MVPTGLNEPSQQTKQGAAMISQEPAKTVLTGAYGGQKWSERTASMREDMPHWWGDWGVSSECGTLRAVLLRRPGPELDAIEDYDAAQMRADLVPGLARAQHDTLVAEYEAQGVAVHLVENARMDKPNSFFIRDLM